MNRTRIVATTLAWAAILATSLACVLTPITDGGTDGTNPNADVACVPGTTLACTCTDGRSGAQSCNTAGTGYGACTCTSGCSAGPGVACTSPDQCCAINGTTPATCASLPGAGQICSARCTTHTECSTGCCAQLADGTRACNVARWCASTGACTVAVGQPCASDDQCCPDTTNAYPSACSSGTSGLTVCSTLCVNNGGCASSCCLARSDGVKTCRPTSECQ